ncbi:MAG: nucleotidyltransferase [Candidatus Vogelbacteria bacterium]|nr:nucleotidyltransferase [Candidatus Vogelbacteria bacterium]
MIPESQLEIWAKQGATVTAKATHESIRNALESSGSPIKDRIKNGGVEIYLQGSYKDDTNIRGDSDVDLVVELNTTFGHNAHELPPEQKRLHDLAYENAWYDWEDFRNDVIEALNKYYGSKYIDTNGNKSLKVLPTSGRLKADVVPAIKFRSYNHFKGANDFNAERGIKFYHRTTKRAIINFPRHHFNNGKTKNAEDKANGWFKHAVRIFKNARSFLVDNNSLPKETAPSYFLQSLIYNAPDNLFGSNYQTTVFNVLKYLYETPVSGFLCQNERHLLFGNTPEQWNESDAALTIQKLVELWDNWNTT